MPTTNKEREIRIAQRRVEGFAQEFGEAHRNLARHAAFPLVLTPDLLYQIWANFVPEAPWTAVAHVLLSRLCRQVSYEMYEMDIADRNLLLRELKEQFGQERFDELGEFLLDYVAQRLTDDDADTRDLREAQEWTALAYTKPDEVGRELAQRLSERLQHEDMGEVLRLTSLVETLAEPLVKAGFKPLLVYSKAMVAISDCEQQGAVSQLRELITGDDKQSNTILCYLYEKLEQDIFIEFVNENYYYFEDAELLLTAIYNNEYLDFESFVDLAIQTLKPDFDGKVYVKYERYYSTSDEGERYVGSLGQQADQMHLSKVPEFITESHSDSLGVILENEQDIEMVLAILSTGEYELPESDIEGGTIEISIQEPELLEDYYEEDEGDVSFGEDVESTEHKISVEPDEEILTTKKVPVNSNTTGATDVTPVVALKELVARMHREQSKIQDLFSSLGFALRSFNNLNQFLELIPLLAVRFSDADGSALFLYKPNGQVVLEQLHWQDSRQRKKIRTALETVASQIKLLPNNEPTVTPIELLNDLMHQHLGIDMQIFGTAILVKHTERGSLYVLSRDPEYTWTETRQKLVRLVADQTAVAIENDELSMVVRQKETKENIQGKLEAVPFMLSLGATVEQIAEALSLDIESVRLVAAKTNINEKKNDES